MSTDTNQAVVQRQPQRAPVPVGDRGIQIHDMDSLWRFSNYVSASGLAPKGIEKPEAVFVAIQMGFEIGLTPMAALQNIAVINGRPSVWGDAQLGVVRGSSLMDAYSEEETNDELHPLFVEMCLESAEAKRKELKKELSRKQAKMNRKTDDYGFSVHTRRGGEDDRFGRFTIADAKTASLWAKSGPWTQYPQRMLKFRARSFLLRDCYGDALKGILSAEEAQDTEERRFDAAKPVVVAEATAFLPTPQAEVVIQREEATEVAKEPTKESDPAKEVAKTAEPEKPKPSKEKTEPSPHQDLRALLDANAITPDAFLNWAVKNNQALDTTERIDEIPPARIKVLLKNSEGLVKAIKEEA